MENDATPLGEHRDAITDWLRRALSARTLEIVGEGRPPTNGSSNETVIVDTRYVSAGGVTHDESFVIRRPPRGWPLYQHYDLLRQYRTMLTLLGTDVPVPQVCGIELDPEVIGEPFYLMLKIEGRTPPDRPPFTEGGWLLDATAAEQAELYASSIEMLARVNRLDPGSLGVDFLRTGEAATGFEEQLLAAERWFRWAADGQPQPVLDATLAWLHAHRPKDPPPEGLNWGDARIGNMLYDGFRPVGVLDWEMAGLGPAEVDLGWWLFLNRHHSIGLGLPMLPGFPDDATAVAMYEEALGRRTRDVFYCDVFGGFRFGIVVLRAVQGAISAGRMPADSTYGQVNGATTLLAQMLDLPAPGAS
jgi:aminoglycoside phosphotransferase (APT) family kinase protein